MALKKPRLNGGAFLFATVNALLLQLLDLREAKAGGLCRLFGREDAHGDEIARGFYGLGVCAFDSALFTALF